MTADLSEVSLDAAEARDAEIKGRILQVPVVFGVWSGAGGVSMGLTVRDGVG